MAALIKKHSSKIGKMPGSVVFVGDQKVEKSRIDVIDFNETQYRELSDVQIEDCLPLKDSPTVTWINITGIHDVDLVQKLGSHFGIHELILEDIAHTGQRPKFEDMEDYIYIVIKMLNSDPQTEEVVSEQVSIVLGKNYVLTFQEREGDVFDYVRKRIKNTSPRVRFLNPDYLAYTLIDAVVDNYFVILEAMGEDIEDLEDDLINDPSTEDLEITHHLKRELLAMRRRVWPLREVIAGIERIDSKLINRKTLPYLRDLYDHVVQVIDMVETFREMVSGLLDIYLSSVSNKMNEVMKVLTIIATIFIPLGFLAGVYGMNFDREAGRFNMPELGLPYGYLLFWLVAAGIAAGLFFFFRRKRWL